MSYKAVLVDFDGTLVGESMEISHQTKKKIKQIIAQGIIFSIASGRRYLGHIKEAIKELGITNPAIVCGGAEIVNASNGQILWIESIPNKDAHEIINYLLEKQIPLSVEAVDSIYSNKFAFVRGYGDGIENRDIAEFSDQNPVKIILRTEDSTDFTQLKDEMEKKFRNIHVVKWKLASGKTGLDITSEKANKHFATLKWQKLMKLKTAEIVAVGDGYNDYSLLTAAGYKVAMGNGPDELKEIADFVAPDVENEGLLVALNKVFP